MYIYIYIHKYIHTLGGVCVVMYTVVGNGHNDTS